MKKIVVCMHTSLDGFVGGPNGEMDWIHVDDEMFEYAGKQTDEADTALYGRVTYEMMESYWPTAADQPGATKHDIQHSHWYNNVAKIILSRTMSDENLKNTRIIRDNISNQVAELKQQPGKNILIFGSPTAVHSLLAENLVDEFWLFINPVILGQGIPLFAGMKDKLKLKLLFTKVFSSGVVALNYEKEV
jgi:dihydrofolate reductase